MGDYSSEAIADESRDVSVSQKRGPEITEDKVGQMEYMDPADLARGKAFTSHSRRNREHAHISCCIDYSGHRLEWGAVGSGKK